MANTANVGFFGPNNPSIQAQQQQLAISKAFAEQLTKAGSEQSQTEFAGGLAVPQSSAVGAGKMAQMLAGAYINRKSQDKANDLATNSYNSMAGMYGAPQYPSAAPEASSQGTILSRMLGMSDAPAAPDASPTQGQPSPQELASAMGAPNAQPSQVSPEPQTPFKLQGFSGQDSMMLAQTNPEAYARILENQHHMTDKMIENQSMGITAPQARTMALAPLAGQIGPNGSVSMDAQGNPTIAPVPGAAGVITANKRAEAAGTLGKQTMTMPDGSVRTDVPVFGNGEILTPQTPMPNNPTAQKFGQPVQVTQPPSLPAGQPAAPNSMDSVLASAQQPQGQPVTPPVGNLSNVPPQPASFGSDPAAMKNKETFEGAEGTNIAETKKAYDAAISQVPTVLGNFQAMREAAPDASYGATSFITKPIAQMYGGKTADANTMLTQKGAQNTIKEIGPILTGAGVKGNRFLEQLSQKATSYNEDDKPPQKLLAINGLDDTYVKGLKGMAQVLRDAGQPAMTDAEIDALAQKSRIAPNLKNNPAAPAADPISSARAAISAGADRNAVIKRLKDNNIDTTGL